VFFVLDCPELCLKIYFGKIATHQLKANMDFQTNVEVNGLFFNFMIYFKITLKSTSKY
jgi:hypothetical protein